MLELKKPLHLQTPSGPGWCYFVIDYGPETSLIWVVFLDHSGECLSVPNPEIRLSWNWTMGRRPETQH